jgi:hypothetical protein
MGFRGRFGDFALGAIFLVATSRSIYEMKPGKQIREMVWPCQDFLYPMGHIEVVIWQRVTLRRSGEIQS